MPLDRFTVWQARYPAFEFDEHFRLELESTFFNKARKDESRRSICVQKFMRLRTSQSKSISRVAVTFASKRTPATVS